MATGAGTLSQPLNWRRLAEWLAMAALVLTLVMAFVHDTRYVRGQAELAAIKTTVAALRTALVVEHLRQQVAGTSAAQMALPVGFNPFDLVRQKPATYVGVMSQLQSQGAAAGSWVYAASCPCVGYRPQDDQWLDSPVDDNLIWFQVTGMPGVLQLVPKEKYRWNNELIN